MLVAAVLGLGAAAAAPLPPLEIVVLDSPPAPPANPDAALLVQRPGAVGTRLTGGELLAVWPAAPGQIVAQFLTGPYAAARPYLVATDVDGAAALAVQPLLDGGALVLYRAVQAGGPSLATLRLHGRRWEHKGRVPASPSAIRFRVDGGRVAVVWADRPKNGPPRLEAAFSPDAGARYLQPITIATGPGALSPDLVLLHDAAALVTWRDDTGIRLQRLSPEWYTDPPVPVTLGTAPIGAPALELTQDYAGNRNDAVAILSVNTASGPKRARIRIPETDLLAAAAEECHCAPSAVQLRGYPLRGTVIAWDSVRGLLTLDHDAIAGVMDPGRHTFRLADSTHPQLRTGGDCLGRIDRVEGQWEIFDLRRLGD